MFYFEVPFDTRVDALDALELAGKEAVKRENWLMAMVISNRYTKLKYTMAKDALDRVDRELERYKQHIQQSTKES